MVIIWTCHLCRIYRVPISLSTLVCMITCDSDRTSKVWLQAPFGTKPSGAPVFTYGDNAKQVSRCVMVMPRQIVNGIISRIEAGRRTNASLDWTIISSDNGLAPNRRQAIIWTHDDWLWIGRQRTNSSDIWIKIHYLYKKMNLKMSPANMSAILTPPPCDIHGSGCFAPRPF